MSEQQAESLIQGLDVSHGDEWVVVRWRRRYAEPCEVIVVKSEVGYARDLGEIFADEPVQHAIYFDTGSQCQDQDLAPGVKYYYTVFAQAPDGTWHRQGREHATVRHHRDQIPHTKFHQDGTLLAKLDTLRVGQFSAGGYGAGGT